MATLLEPVACVEAFHLGFLRVLERRLDRSRYAVKGGVNLRAWFGSARYSEDLDVDALGGEPHSLEAAVDRVLGSRDLQLLLELEHLRVVRASKPKMTDTTQRWKLQIQSGASAVPMPTKIEFSRRESKEPYLLEPVLSEIAKRYAIPAPTANHYTGAAAVRQKIRALAQRRTPQARDIWDLEHLFRVVRADPKPLACELRAMLQVAQDRVLLVEFSDYQAQVVPFLAADHRDLFGNEIAWDRIRDLVLDRLAELAS